LLFGFAGLFFGFLIYRILFFIGALMLQGYYANNAFYSEYPTIFSMEFEIFMKIEMMVYLLGFFIFFFFIESVLKRTKYVITLTYI